MDEQIFFHYRTGNELKIIQTGWGNRFKDKILVRYIKSGYQVWYSKEHFERIFRRV